MRPVRRPLAPLLPPAICLATGIAAGQWLHLPWWVLLPAIAVTLLARRWPLVQSIALWGCFLLLGMVASTGAQTERLPDGCWAEAVVTSVPAEKPKTVMADLLLPQTGEQRRCYFWKDERSMALATGQDLLVRIHDEHFVWNHDWHWGGNASTHLSRWQRLRLKALKWRSMLAKRLPAAGEEDTEAVLAAMVLGDKSALTPQLRQTYSQTGASHLLALSGLHLSVIYLLLTRLTQGRRRFWLLQVLVVFAIWAFALLTGLSPSVVRAATMLTVYALFELGGRRHAPLGVLSFTAIVMLLADSSALFDIGFQLSFMAMLGILLFCPLFEEKFTSACWLMSHRLVRWFFGLVSVSVAAQLGTAPLVVFHFGQFPTWFLLTNLVAVPLATAILHVAVFTFVFPALGSLLLWLVAALNNSLQLLSHLPLSCISGLRPNFLQTAMAYVLVAVLYLLLKRLPQRYQT